VFYALFFPLHRVHGRGATAADQRDGPGHPALALDVTIGLHLWRRHALLSILGGTTVNVLLASTLLSR
jgi:hypothetical protein